METHVLNYRIVITSENHKGRMVYNAYASTLGVADWGNTVEEATAHIQEAIECHLEGLVKNHEPIPAPDSGDGTIAMTSVAVSLPSRFRPTFI